jgi:hypothetical protein
MFLSLSKDPSTSSGRNNDLHDDVDHDDDKEQA